MSPLSAEHFALLQRALEVDYVPHLPPLLDQTRPAEEQRIKNLSRAFSAFVLHQLCGIQKGDAAKAVVDDFDDYGIDAIYYHGPEDRLYLVQSKCKAGAQFSQQEALAYCQGVRKLITQDFTGFNQHVQNRSAEIEGALDKCSHITLVVAHTGSGISQHAQAALSELLADERDDEERLAQTIIDYDSTCVVTDLQAATAYVQVDARLLVDKCTKLEAPRLTYFGLMQLADLIKLHNDHGKALYEKNIRTFLGHKTEVNASIQQTLRNKPEEFVYLNNGVTALCQRIEPKGSAKKRGGKTTLVIGGLSVINGAQTIASSAKFLKDNQGADVTTAKVSVTLIKADANGDFGKAVTRARNHQNPVYFSNFAALDDEQERLRRELAHLGIDYSYKAEGPEGSYDARRIRIDEAAQALAMFQTDPRYVVWLKKEPGKLLDTASAQYKALFSNKLSAFELANAVMVNRYAQMQLRVQEVVASGRERLAYKHGGYAVAWLLAKRVAVDARKAVLFQQARMNTSLSAPFDALRQHYWDKTRAATTSKGPLSVLRNQAETVPLLQEIAIENFGLMTDAAIQHKIAQQKYGQPYPEELFEYIVSRAPQIGGLL